MKHRFLRLLVPGLVIQAIMVGGGYATGRELVEFFLEQGPATALLGMTFTAAIFSLGSVIAFELARRYRAFDYRSFSRLYSGRLWVLYEFGYIATLLLVLSVISAAAGQLLAQMIGTPELPNSALFMLLVAFLVFFGSSVIERVISAWSVLFYVVYGTMFLMVVAKFGPDLRAAIASTPLRPGAALSSSLSYSGYNLAILPILMFVARNFQSRSEAVISGLLAGPLILLPGFAFLAALSAFYPGILAAPLPISVVLEQLANPVIALLVQVILLGALIKTGVGLLHGLNERVARTLSDQGRTMPSLARPAVAVASMVIAVYVAELVGIVDLIGRGYRYSSYFFLAVFVLPLLTRGLWLVSRPEPRQGAAVKQLPV